MVLTASRWLLLAAVLAAGAPIVAEAHRPPAPFRALDGGELKRAGPLRVELLRDDSSLQLVFRDHWNDCLLYTSPSPRDLSTSRMPSSA